MREWCGCGASVRARRRDVLAWRTEHHHPQPTPAGNHPPTSGGSHVENASWPSIGFVPEAP